VILPGATLGVLGGGQLGRMFTIRARTLGYHVTVLDPDTHSPAGSVADRHLRARYDDDGALDELARSCAAVTTEFENVPAHALERLARDVRVSPPPHAVAIAQDRILEKGFLAEHGFPVAPWRPVVRPDDYEAAAEIGAPAILKTSRLGYDGKGQAGIEPGDGIVGAHERLRGVPCVLERRLALECELSVVLARGDDGSIAAFPAAENIHSNGILETTTVPARVRASLASAAGELAAAVATALRYVGVLGVELFVAEGGTLFVNELAPRPHNSGHFTLDATVTDQFEQQVRALCGLPLGDPSLLAPVTMINLLGDAWARGEPRWEEAFARPGVKLHLYGKREPRPGRKMGHLTCLGASPDASFRLAHETLTALERR
jgi:5-(carboxyamino)imidazole ribonucleotide synthase